mgnify:CR=1 FL=1
MSEMSFAWLAREAGARRRRAAPSTLLAVAVLAGPVLAVACSSRQAGDPFFEVPPEPTFRNPRSCPSQPAAGGACDGNIVCTYQPCARDNITRLECTAGKWAVTRTAPCVTPPLPECPSQEPIEGETCKATTGKCYFPDTCIDRPRTGSASARAWTCPSGTWRLTTSRYTARCPVLAPADGSSCESCGPFYPELCSYRGCEAKCDLSTSRWSAVGSFCGDAEDAGAIDAATD